MYFYTDFTWPKAETVRDWLVASSSSDLILTEEWLLTTLLPFLLLQHSRSSLSRVSQNSSGREEAAEVFLSEPELAGSEVGAGEPGRKWMGKLLAREMRTSRVCRQTTGAAWGWTEILAVLPVVDFLPACC